MAKLLEKVLNQLIKIEKQDDSPLTIVSLSAGKVNRTLTTETEKEREEWFISIQQSISAWELLLRWRMKKFINQTSIKQKTKRLFQRKDSVFPPKEKPTISFFWTEKFSDFQSKFCFLETRTSMLRSFFVFLCAGLVWLPYLIANSDLLIVVIEDSTSFDISAPCFIFSGGRYKCTNSKNWDGGRGQFPDPIGTKGFLTGVVVVTNGNSQCSQTTSRRDYAFYMNGFLLGDWTSSNVPYNCALGTCDAVGAAPNVIYPVSNDTFYLYNSENTVEMKDTLGDGVGCFGSYNVTLAYQLDES